MPLDQEDIKAYHDQLATDKQDALEAKAEIKIANYLDEAHSKSGFIADLAKNLDSDDFYRLAKMFEKAGDAQLALERTSSFMKRNAIL